MEASLLILLKDYKPVIDILINSKFLPWAKQLFKNKKSEYALNEKQQEEVAFYFENSMKTYSTINTIVFSNEPKFIQELYIPMTLVDSRDGKATIITESFDLEKIYCHNKILINDTAGMGKSTLSKWLYISTISSKEYIPFFLELRKLSTTVSVEDLVMTDLNSRNEVFEKKHVSEILKSEKIVLLLDGLDEIELENRKEIFKNLLSFINSHPNAKIILTSRPEQFLVGATGFITFNIKPLTRDEAYGLIKKYDKNNKFSANLIEAIEGSAPSVHDFLKNPLTVSLLIASYSYKPVIANNKVVFYDQVFDALFERHDYSKGDAFDRKKISGLDKFKFLTILRYFAAQTTFKTGKIEYLENEFCALLRDCKNSSAIDFNENHYLQDLKKTVPLFLEVGNHIRWSHKSFQDYYAACFLKYEYGSRINEIIKSLKDDRFENVLEFYYELDEKTVKKLIFKDQLKNMIDFKADIEEKFKNNNLFPDNVLIEKIFQLFYSSNYLDPILCSYNEEEKKMEENERASTCLNRHFQSPIFRERIKESGGSVNEDEFVENVVILVNKTKERNHSLNLALKKLDIDYHLDRVGGISSELSGFLKSNNGKKYFLADFITDEKIILNVLDFFLRDSGRILDSRKILQRYQEIIQMEENEKKYELKF